MPKNLSLQKRLLTRTLGTVLLVWFITAVIVWLDAQHELDELLDAHLAQSAALLVVQQNATSDDQASLPAPATLHKYAHRVAYQVFDGGRLTLHSPNATHTPLAKHTSGFATLTLADKHSWRVFATQGGSRDVQIYVAEDIDSRDEILYAVMRSFLLPLIIALPILLSVLWWNVRSGLQPLQRLRQALLQRDTQTLTPFSLSNTPPELQPMLDALNDLLQRLAQRLQSERRFNADAAHELRTPIAAIRTQAQVAIGASQNDPLRQQALKDTISGCDRAVRVVEQLLTLTRIEGPEELATEPFRLDQVIQQVMADLAPQALLRNQNLALDAPNAVQVNGQSTLWEILLRNLIDNALRHSPIRAAVEIHVSAASDGRVQVILQDSGPGLSADNMARLGDRFFRVLGTSSSTGCGLGWSIVRHIAALQRIEIQLTQSPTLGGLMVTLTIEATNLSA